MASAETPTVRSALQKPERVLSPILCPGSRARSTMRTRVSGLCSLSIDAYSVPMGPAPITTTSYLSLMASSVLDEMPRQRLEPGQRSDGEAGGSECGHGLPAKPARDTARSCAEHLEMPEYGEERRPVVTTLGAARAIENLQPLLRRVGQ